ncbi:hypothetical protein H4582DRAFT_1949924 [Lactarius indigo]|nr:hypothetical protein H4582DRAFT_1949924 [Lactarius indigo]
MPTDSEVWNVAGKIATAQSVVGIAAVRVVTSAIWARFPSVEALLDACSKDLKYIEERIKQFGPDRRELIRAAVERQQCKSLESLEIALQRLRDEHNDLSLRSEQSSCWERNLPYSMLREDIDQLKEATRSLLTDTRNTTSARMTQGRSHSPRSDPAPLPTLPRLSSPTTDDMNTPTIAHRPDEYSLDSLDTTRPALAYIPRMDQDAVSPV